MKTFKKKNMIESAELVNNNYLESVICSYHDGVVVYHNFDPKKNILGAGKPLTLTAMQRIFKSINKMDLDVSYGFKGIIPKNVISFTTDEKKIVWVCRAGQKELFFKEETGIESGTYPIPDLLFKLHGDSLKVFALREFPEDENSALYHAPFMNTYDDGTICMGSAKIKKKFSNYDEIMLSAEDAFFGSFFTHISGNLKRVKGIFTNEIKSSMGKRKFNNKILIKTEWKLSKLL